MATLLRFSEAAALALHAMTYIASASEEVITARTLAYVCRASEAHMTKVCQRLARGGLLATRRGARGGFALGPRASRIRLLDIYAAIEGKVVLRKCLFEGRSCRGHQHKKGTCVLGRKVNEVEREFLAYLKSTKLAAVAAECAGNGEAT
jgi:Rrf2 family protein